MNQLKALLSESNVKKIVFFLLTVFFISVLYSLFMLSLVIFIIAGISLIYRLIHRIPPEKHQIWPGLLTMACYFPFLIGFIISDNTSEATQFLRLNASYFFVPSVIALIPAYNKKDMNSIILMFVGVLSASSLIVLVNYLSHFNEVTASLGSGKSVPTPIDHVRYSILISFALVWSFLLVVKKESFKFLPKWVLPLVFAYLMLFVHILAVRSGIILTYCGIGFSAIIIFGRRKKPYTILSILLILILAPIVAYHTIPSFQNKIKYTIYDLKEFQKGAGANHSDSERLRSLIIGIEIWKDNPLLGAGTGDVRSEINKRYVSKYGTGGQPKFPHNQFLKLLAISGIIGLALYITGFFAPLLINHHYKNIYLTSFLMMILISFLVEATLERSYSLALFCIIVSLFYGLKQESKIT